MKLKLSMLWIVVMFNMAFADILSIFLSSFLKENVEGPAAMPVTETLLLIMAIFVEIPLIMIILTHVLSYRINRWMNIIAACITIIFVVVGGATYWHYLFFAAVEIVCLVLIIRFSWNWKTDEFNHKPINSIQ